MTGLFFNWLIFSDLFQYHFTNSAFVFLTVETMRFLTKRKKAVIKYNSGMFKLCYTNMDN